MGAFFTLGNFVIGELKIVETNPCLTVKLPNYSILRVVADQHHIGIGMAPHHG
jgi:hypothetical protein